MAQRHFFRRTRAERARLTRRTTKLSDRRPTATLAEAGNLRITETVNHGKAGRRFAPAPLKLIKALLVFGIITGQWAGKCIEHFPA
jgi:hypothetical protein